MKLCKKGNLAMTNQSLGGYNSSIHKMTNSTTTLKSTNIHD